MAAVVAAAKMEVNALVGRADRTLVTLPPLLTCFRPVFPWLLLRCGAARLPCEEGGAGGWVVLAMVMRKI